MVRLCQVKLGELWLRERGHQEGQVACCKRDMARGLARLEGEFTRVAQWARTRRGQQEVARWVVTTVWVTAHHHPREAGEGQRQVCERLHGELALLREYRLLREEERSRIEGRERRKRDRKEKAREMEERERRERERGTILAWRRNRIEVASLSRLQVSCGWLTVAAGGGGASGAAGAQDSWGGQPQEDQVSPNGEREKK